MSVPENLRYSSDHEWADIDSNTEDANETTKAVDAATEAANPSTIVRVGITAHAQEALGDVIYVELPQLGVKLTQHESFGEVESTKSVSELYAPVSGKVVAVNHDLFGAPQRLNEDPYGAGWICKIACDDLNELESLHNAQSYRKLIEGK